MMNYEPQEEEPVQDKMQDKVQDKVRNKFPEVSDAAWAVFDIIRQQPQSTVNDICGLLSIKERQVYKHLALLKSLGIIVRVGSNKTGYWKVNIA